MANEILIAIMWYFGCNEHQARVYFLNAPQSTINEIVVTYRRQCKLVFYND